MLVRGQCDAMRCAANAVYRATCQMRLTDWTEAACVYVRCVSQQIQVQDPHSSAGILTAAAMHLTRMDRNVENERSTAGCAGLNWTWTGLALSGLVKFWSS